MKHSSASLSLSLSPCCCWDSDRQPGLTFETGIGKERKKEKGLSVLCDTLFLSSKSLSMSMKEDKRGSEVFEIVS